MKRQHLARTLTAVTVGMGTFVPPLRADDARPAAPATRPAEVAAPTTRPVAKPLSQPTLKALAWLASQQQQDGGWTQGESSKNQGREGERIDKSNVADTCMAALALIRAGNAPGKGVYSANIRSALDFVCGQVEKAPQEGLLITDIQGSRVQTKLGQYIDTFASALLLAECRNTMPDEASRKRVIAALDKTMDKIEKNQKKDGRWVDAHDGWASALCQSVATKAVNRAAQGGANVSPAVIDRAQSFAANQFDARKGAVNSDGSANVELYARASNLQSFQDSDNTNKSRKLDIQKHAEHAATQVAQAEQRAAQRRQAGDEEGAVRAATQAAQAQDEVGRYRAQLDGIQQNQENLKAAQNAIVQRLDDKGFVAGFGSNGGEEFLSYMNIGESLLLKGGDEFARWDKSMTENLVRIQDNDGSWSGQHCITGRTFCTSAALLVLMVDRSAPAPAAVHAGIAH